MKGLKRLCALLLTAACFSTVVLAADYKIYTAEEINGPSGWAAAEIQQARDAQLLTEHTATAFKMDITRFQFAELAVNLVEKVTGAKLTPAPDDTFTDCTEPVVLKAYAAGLTTGTGDGTTFSPDHNITREQIATMLVRAVAAVEQETGETILTATGDLSTYTDAASVSSWARDGVTTLNAAGIMKGTSGSTLTPQGTTTIQEAVILTLRIFQSYS